MLILVRGKHIIGGKNAGNERSYNNQFLELPRRKMIHKTTSSLVYQANPCEKILTPTNLSNSFTMHNNKTPTSNITYGTALAEHQQDTD